MDDGDGDGDLIRQLDDHEQLKSARFLMSNNMGRGLLGFTVEDAKGCCFATSWVWFLLPIFPLKRYYLKRTKRKDVFNPMVDTQHFYIYGTGPLRAAEVLRTYVLSWVAAPLVVAGPFVLWVIHADSLIHSVGFGLMLTVAMLLPIVSTLLGVALMYAVRRRLFASRAVEWVGEPDPRWLALANRPLSGI